jgi:hypothetical protein
MIKVVHRRADFARALRQKMILEIAGANSPHLTAAELD